MSGILNRTIFMGTGRDKILRFSPWCRVITGIGYMIEPYGFNLDNYGKQDFEWSDWTNRIDGLESFDPNAVTWNDNTTGGPTGPVQGV